MAFANWCTSLEDYHNCFCRGLRLTTRVLRPVHICVHVSGLTVPLVCYVVLGILPTTVLGQVSAPDADDWDRKIYHFEGKTSRYLERKMGVAYFMGKLTAHKIIASIYTDFFLRTRVQKHFVG